MEQEIILEARNITKVYPGGVVANHNVNLQIKKGEILGAAGVAGSGQKELCETIAGLMQAKEGAILYKKTNLLGKTPSEIINLGISMSFVPEDRLGMGLVGSMGMTGNMMLRGYNEGRGIFANRKEPKELAEKIILMVEAAKDKCANCATIAELSHFLVKRSQWIIGGDGASYDIVDWTSTHH